MRNIDRTSVIFILLIYLIALAHSLHVGDRFFLDDSIASELEDWELRWLKDAVRRGRAFVSKGVAQGDDDSDWDSFARSIQAKNSRTSSASRPIPASEPSFLGSFGGATGPVVSIGPPQSGGGSSFASLPAAPPPPAHDNNAMFNFGQFDPNSFMQPVAVQQQPHAPVPQLQFHHPSQPPPPRPFQRRITTSPPPPPPPSRPEPAIDVDNADFESVLRLLIGRRKNIMAEEDGDMVHQAPAPPPPARATATTTASPAKRRKALRPLNKNIITGPDEVAVGGGASWRIAADSSRQRTTTVLPPTLPGHPTNEWVMMNPDDPDPEREEVRVPDQLPVPTGDQDEENQQQQPQKLFDQIDRVDEQSFSLETLHKSDPEEERIRALSIELAEILKKMKRKHEPKVKKKPAKPRVIVIRNGTAEGLANRQYNLVATITLIRDSGKNILVDTGLATDINGRTEMIRRLESLGVPTPSVHVVVSTHGHPDHAGNSHIFPDAVQYHGWFVHERTVFNLSNLFDSDREQITSAVSLLRTPGHTSEDISVLVRDAVDEWGAPLGNVAVAGDVFVRREDIENDREWVPLSADVKSQALSRRTLLCKSDCIVPGHGPPFLVDAQLRTRFKC